MDSYLHLLWDQEAGILKNGMSAVMEILSVDLYLTLEFISSIIIKSDSIMAMEEFGIIYQRWKLIKRPDFGIRSLLSLKITLKYQSELLDAQF